MWYNSSASREELLYRLRFLEPSQDFRTTWQYQNLMFLTAGFLVEKISGTSWEKFTKSRILVPLGMMDSNFSVEESKKASDFALPYRKKDGKIIEIPFRNIDTVGPAGSINSSVTDMANWLLLNLKEGKIGDAQVVSQTSMKETHSPQMIISKNLSYEELHYSLYGMGWMIDSYRGNLLLSHGGGIDGFTAHVSFMPKEKMGMVILTNRGGTPSPTIVSYNAYDRLLGLNEIPWNKRLSEQVKKNEEEAKKTEKNKNKDRKSGTKPSHDIDDYVGDYKNPGYGIYSIKKDGENLLGIYNDIETKIEHYHYDIFSAKNSLLDLEMKMAFFIDEKGNINSLSVRLEPSVEEIVFTRVPEKKLQSRSFLEKFTGEYTMSNATVKIYFKGENTLFLSIPGQPEYEMVPYRDHEFTLKNAPGVNIEFVLDEAGNVKEALVSQAGGVFTAVKK
jgi:hypothetical protein